MLCEVQSCVFGIVTLKHGIWVKYESIVTFPCVIKFTSCCPLPSKSTNRFVWSCFGLFLLVNSVWSVHIYFCWFRQDYFFTEATNIMDRGLAFTFMHLADAFIQSDLQLHSGYTFLISMCVPWESNPQPFALLTQCSNHWATQDHFSWKQLLEMKNIVHLAAFHKTLMDWSGVDYCNVFISCLDSHSDGTHSPQRSHWWASDAMLHFSKSDEETNSSTSCMTWVRVKFQHIVISGWTISKMHAHEEDRSVQKWLALTFACSPELAQSNLYWAGARPSAESTAPASLTWTSCLWHFYSWWSGYHSSVDRSEETCDRWEHFNGCVYPGHIYLASNYSLETHDV